MNRPDEPLDATDVAILGQVRSLLTAVDPVPADLTDQVRFALTVQALHAEVAELTRGDQLAVRGGETAEGVESVTFTAASVSLMVSAKPSSDGRTTRVDGWVTRGGAVVEVVVGDDRRTITSDDHGRFSVDDLPRGRTYFVIRVDPDDEAVRPVITPEVNL